MYNCLIYYQKRFYFTPRMCACYSFAFFTDLWHLYEKPSLAQ